MLERLFVGILLIVAAMCVFSPWVSRWLDHARAVPALLWVFAISRFGAWSGCYVLIPGLVRSSDLVLYYYPEALNAAQGQIPYIDFATSYGPLFPYLAGAILPFWQSHAAVALIMVACEVLAVFVFSSIVRKQRSAESPGTADSLLARALFLYTVSPAALYWSGMIAYNSSVVLLCWVVAAAFLFAQRFGTSLIALSASLLVGKALGLLVSPLWLADPRRRIGYIAGAAALAIVAFFVASHFDINLLQPLQREGERSTPGNVWFLLSGMVPLSADSGVWMYAPLASFAIAVGVLTSLLLMRWKRAPSLVQFSAAIATVGWLFMLLSKKTYPHYTPMFLLFCVFALCASKPRGIWIGLLALLGAIGIIEPGLWNSLGQPVFLSGACGENCSAPEYYALIGSDVAIVTIEAYLAISCARLACKT